MSAPPANIIQHTAGPPVNFPRPSLDHLEPLRPREGVRIALELIEQMKPWARGIYLMPQFGRYDLAAEVMEKCR